MTIDARRSGGGGVERLWLYKPILRDGKADDRGSCGQEKKLVTISYKRWFDPPALGEQP